MRGKKLFIFLFSLLVFLSIPLSDVFAASYTNGLFDKLSSSDYTLEGSYHTEADIKKMIDNNGSTYPTGRDKAFTITITLKKAVTINEYFVYMAAMYELSNAISFYDSNDNLVYSSSIPHQNGGTNNGKYISISPVEVKKVIFTKMNSSNVAIMNEFEMFEAPYADITNMVVEATHESAVLTWDTPLSSDFTGTKLYKNGVFLESFDNTRVTYIDTDVQPNTSYIYKLTAVYADGTETAGLSKTIVTKTEPVDESTIPPANVTALKVSEITETTALLSWTNPTDDDLAGINIYKGDNSLLTKITVTDSYLIENLEPDTDYKFFVSAFDTDGNESGKVPIVFKTMYEKDDVPPAVPTNLMVEGGSNSLYVTWDRSPDSDLAGYNIYIDGLKHNVKLVKGLFYAIPNLENERVYSVQVSAVDRSGNESQLSLAASGTPIASGMPILSTKYDLKDVAVGIEKWFSSYWLILAFAIAIPLSFYIASRIKLMFLE